MTQGNNSNSSFFTSANIVTTIRIALIPLFVFILLAPWPSWVSSVELSNFLQEGQLLIAAIVFVLLALTDSLDGYLARSRNEVTTIGKFLDPLADKILVASALLALIELDQLPAWVALVIIMREFLISGLRMAALVERVVIAASPLGKIKTTTQIIAVLLFIVKGSPFANAQPHPAPEYLNAFAWIIMVIALVLTIWSLIDYVVKSRLAFGFLAKKAESSPASGAFDGGSDKNPSANLESFVLRDAAALVIEYARKQKITIGTVESCTGGLVAAALTSTPGSSAVFKGSVVSYVNEIKESILGVSLETLASVGAVSEATACEMANGALETLKVDRVVSVTGIAGPDGGSEEKPVGTVWFGLAVRDNTGVTVSAELRCFSGTRDEIREQATLHAVHVLIQSLDCL